jgi:polyribonucleotide nucleotidyltransferase
MDIKVEGITLPVLRDALESARVGLIHILGEMEKANPPVGGKMSEYAPQIEVVHVPSKYIGKIIGKGGEQIKSICEETKVDTIDINDEGRVTITGSFGCDMTRALEIVAQLTVEPVVGKIYRGARVTKVLEFGAFVEILPGVEGLCHVSELDVTRVANVKDVVNEGDRIDVKLVETNERGQFKLSRREVMLDEGGEAVRKQLEEAKGAQSSGGGWEADRGGMSQDDSAGGRGRGRPPPKARRGRSRLRE